MSSDTRKLGPKMLTDGWLALGGDSIMWCHPPSRRVVKVDGPWKFSIYTGWPMAPGEELESDAEVYAVSCHVADECGYPTDVWDGFLTVSYARALRAAIATRAAIMANQQQWRPSKQLTFDDLLERDANCEGKDTQ
jgi:hypothetical protein